MRLQNAAASVLVAVFALAACTTTAPGTDAASPEQSDPTRIGYASVEAALAAVRARPGVSESQLADGWTVIEDKAHNETWLFSPAGHPAHPAVVKRTVTKRPGESSRTQTAAMCSASQAECDRLVAQMTSPDGSPDLMRQTGQPMVQPSRSGGRY